MKINGNLDSGALDKLTKPGKGNASPGVTSAEGKTQESAVAALSGKYSDVKAGEAPLNAKKVEEIRQAILDGRFEVNPEAIADSIIRSAKELTGQN